jgi:hypothetical protein
MSLNTLKTSNTERLAALVMSKQQVLEILVQMSRQQLALIDAGDLGTLMKLLAGKQTVITHLHHIERELTPFRDEEPEQRVWTSPDHRTACQARAQQCNSLLAEVMDLERRAESSMHQRRNATAAALSSLQAGAEAKAAYHALPSTMLTSLQVEG